MDGAEEAELPSTDVVTPEKEENLHSSFSDHGPAEAQCLPSLGCEDELDELKTCGIHMQDASPLMSEEDTKLCDVVKAGIRSMSHQTQSMNMIQLKKYSVRPFLGCSLEVLEISMIAGKGRYLLLTGLLGCCNTKMGDLPLIKCGASLP
jgi:hypothetical protein